MYRPQIHNVPLYPYTRHTHTYTSEQKLRSTLSLSVTFDGQGRKTSAVIYYYP